MNTIQRIAKNTSSLFLAQFISSILGFILSIFIARSLGVALFGKYSFALAFTAFFVIFSDFGYHTLLVREVSKDKSQAYKYLSNIISIRIVLAIIFFILIVILINLMGYPEDTKNVVYLLGFYSILTSFSLIFRMIFRAFEKMEYDGFVGILTNITKFSLGILVLSLGFGLMGLGFAFIFVGVFEVLLSFILCRKKFVNPKMEIDLAFWKDTIKVALPICMAAIFGLIYIRTDTIMLSIMKGDAVVGWYNAAYNLTLGLLPFPDLFMNALLPLMASYSVFQKKSLKRVYEISFKYLFMLGLPLAVGTTLLADKIIFFFYGSQFSNSIIALQILAWDILLLFLYRCMYYLLISIGQQKQIMKIAGICALVNVGLNLALIPLFSYVGAGVATIITELTLLGLFFYISSKNVYRLPLHKIMIRPIIASTLMSILIYIFSDMKFALVVVLSIVFYFIVLYLLGGITQEDTKMLRKVFRKNV